MCKVERLQSGDRIVVDERHIEVGDVWESKEGYIHVIPAHSRLEEALVFESGSDITREAKGLAFQ